MCHLLRFFSFFWFALSKFNVMALVWYYCHICLSLRSLTFFFHEKHKGKEGGKEQGVSWEKKFWTGISVWSIGDEWKSRREATAAVFFRAVVEIGVLKWRSIVKSKPLRLSYLLPYLVWPLSSQRVSVIVGSWNKAKGVGREFRSN